MPRLSVRRRRTNTTALVSMLLCALVAFGATGCRDVDRPGAPSNTPTAVTPGAAMPTKDPGATHDTAADDQAQRAAAALRELDAIAVKGRTPMTGYSREQFGAAWSDDVSVTYGHNSCDTRNDILRRDLRSPSFKKGSDCVVSAGTLLDPYTGSTIDFQRGPATSAQVQIDHLVPLANAWVTGAQQWDPAKRRDFANDPRNLLAVDGTTNQAKGAGDAATWLPPDRSYWCTYATKQVQVKSVYGLWTTAAEHDALSKILHRCVTG